MKMLRSGLMGLALVMMVAAIVAANHHWAAATATAVATLGVAALYIAYIVVQRRIKTPVTDMESWGVGLGLIATTTVGVSALIHNEILRGTIVLAGLAVVVGWLVYGYRKGRRASGATQ